MVQQTQRTLKLASLTCLLFSATDATAQCDRWITVATGTTAPGPGIESAVMWDHDSDGTTVRRLVVGGYLRLSDGPSAPSVAVLNEGRFDLLGSEMDLGINVVSVWDADAEGPESEQLIVGGRFTTAGGNPALRIARWDGAAWTTLGCGIGDGEVVALASWDADGSGPLYPQLFAAGSFLTSGDTEVRSIARWDGITWHPVGGGFWGSSPSTVFALTVWDPDGQGPAIQQLIAGGTFRRTGPHFVNGIARWDGVSWQSLGNGPFKGFGWVSALGTWDPDGAGPVHELLIAGGYGELSHPVRAWDGTEWQNLGDRIRGDVFALSSWKPSALGEHPAQLFAAGRIGVGTDKDAESADVARWDGAGWSALPAEPLWRVNALEVSRAVGTTADESCLLAIGDGPSSQGTSALVASWCACSSTRCPGDADGDLDVDIGDIAILIQHWEDMHPSVPPGSFGDLSRNGLVNIEDLAILLPQWGELCR
jgi:hypothetical protein